MAVEPTALSVFLADVFQSKRVKDVVQEWSADPEEIQKLIEKEIVEMGILMVHPASYHNYMVDQVIFLLRNSPQVKTLLHRIAHEAKKRDENKRR